MWLYKASPPFRLAEYSLETIFPARYYPIMPWTVLFHVDFRAEYYALPQPVQDELFGMIEALKEEGPAYGTMTRGAVGTLRSKAFDNLKELRFNCDGVWLFAFAFDPQRQAVILVGGDKEGENEKRFYIRLIGIAERRYAEYLRWLAKTKNKEKGK
jgi:hypothetical protein